jgi:hypothetical protein
MNLISIHIDLTLLGIKSDFLAFSCASGTRMTTLVTQLQTCLFCQIPTVDKYGALVESCMLEETEVLEENPAPVPLSTPQILY